MLAFLNEHSPLVNFNFTYKLQAVFDANYHIIPCTICAQILCHLLNLKDVYETFVQIVEKIKPHYRQQCSL